MGDLRRRCECEPHLVRHGNKRRVGVVSSTKNNLVAGPTLLAHRGSREGFTALLPHYFQVLDYQSSGSRESNLRVYYQRGFLRKSRRSPVKTCRNVDVQHRSWSEPTRTTDHVRPSGTIRSLDPSESTGAFLDRHCGGESVLGRRVEALLSAFDRAPAFIHASAGQGDVAPDWLCCCR
jgi:hypothetical protein